MSAIGYGKLLAFVLLSFLVVAPPAAPAHAQAAKEKAADKSKPITALESKKLLQFFQKRFREKVTLSPDEDDPESLEVEVDGELLGWVRRDADGVTGDNDFIFEWYILEDELDD